MFLLLSSYHGRGWGGAWSITPRRVMRAVKILTDPRAGVRLKGSSVTVSTVGLVPEIKRFCADPENRASLAISLHTVSGPIRDRVSFHGRFFFTVSNEDQIVNVLRGFGNRFFIVGCYSCLDGRVQSARDQAFSLSKLMTLICCCASTPSVKVLYRYSGLLRCVIGMRPCCYLPQDQKMPRTRDDNGVLQVIPVNKRYTLEKLSETLKRHFPRPSTSKAVGSPEGESDRSREHSPERSAEESGVSLLNPKRLQPRRKPRILAVEYTLLGGVNDSVDDAERLADWLEGINCVVNLITFNPHQGTPFSPSSVETSKAFRRTLVERGLLCTVRDSRGDDGMAACG